MTKVTVIKPRTNLLSLDLKELWHYRELFYIFAWRDIKVRYKQTLLGIIWVVFQPLFTMAIFTIFFGRLAKIPSGVLPYSLFVLTGLVWWNYFSGVITHASNSFIDNESIIKKIYFPRIILPLATAVTGLIDFTINFILLLVIFFISGYVPSLLSLIIIPLCLLISAVAAMGVGLFLSSINIKYRDVRYILPFFIQIVMFVSPVIYPTTIVRPSNKLILALNPMTGVIETVRVVLSGSQNVEWLFLGISAFVALLTLVFGLYYFRSTERFIADIV